MGPGLNEPLSYHRAQLRSRRSDSPIQSSIVRPTPVAPAIASQAPWIISLFVVYSDFALAYLSAKLVTASSTRDVAYQGPEQNAASIQHTNLVRAILCSYIGDELLGKHFFRSCWTSGRDRCCLDRQRDFLVRVARFLRVLVLAEERHQ